MGLKVVNIFGFTIKTQSRDRAEKNNPIVKRKINEFLDNFTDYKRGGYLHPNDIEISELHFIETIDGSKVISTHHDSLFGPSFGKSFSSLKWMDEAFDSGSLIAINFISAEKFNPNIDYLKDVKHRRRTPNS